MEFPTTLIEFMEQFPDEEACRSYLDAVRWPGGFECPRCGEREASRIRSRGLYQCSACRHQVSLTAGTVFHGTRTPLRKWFLAIFFLARHKQGISALQLQRDLGVGSYQTAWHMLHKLRSALGRRSGQLLRGRVEADEAFIGGARSGGKPGRGAPNKSVVLVMVERHAKTAGGVALEIVPDGTWESLGPTLRGRIEGANTVILTDGHRGYWPLAKHGVDHEFTAQWSRRAGVEILPWAHLVISNLKAWMLGTFRGVSHRHLAQYLREFAYRFNRRWIEDELFFHFTRRAAEGRPLPYRDLVAEGAG